MTSNISLKEMEKRYIIFYDQLINDIKLYLEENDIEDTITTKLKNVQINKHTAFKSGDKITKPLINVVIAIIKENMDTISANKVLSYLKFNK